MTERHREDPNDGVGRSDVVGRRAVVSRSDSFLDAVRRLLTGSSAASSGKTVSFGDATAVRGDFRWSVVSFLGLMALWFFLKVGGDSAILSDRTFPTQRATWEAFIGLWNEGYRNVSLWEHTSASLWRVVRGMFWGIVIGVPVGLAMGLSSRLRGLFDTPVELFRPIPPLALLPLFVLWFGIGDPTAVRLLIFASVWIMILAARSGVGAVNVSKVHAAYSLGASKLQVLTRVIVPNAFPDLITGVRVALGVCWGTLVAAELVGTSTGLGAMIFSARNFFRIDVIVVGTIIIAVIGVLMDIVMRVVEAKLIPWRGRG
jgi:taurine transport system permease protein